MPSSGNGRPSTEPGAPDARRPPSDADFQVPDLSPAQFERISALLHRLSGITLRSGKDALVKARLVKRLRALGLASFAEYVAHVEHDQSGEELSTMIDALTTNKTSFFREPQHFGYLREHLLPGLGASGRRFRVWSAGCSSGEEPYSIAITVMEELPDAQRQDVRVLATDISTRMLAKARQAAYEEEALQDVPAALVRRHFTLAGAGPPRRYRVNDDVRALVRLARLNLVDAWPMHGPFDVIFCRNVMIYFDDAIRQRLVQRFWQLLPPGGYLFVGHAESLNTYAHSFRYVQPAVYVRDE